MTRFLIRRILQGVLVMWLVTISVFLIFFVGPGPASVAHRLAGKQATPATIERFMDTVAPAVRAAGSP